MAKSVVVADQPSTGLQQLRSHPERLGTFLRDVRSEMRKVVTPSRDEVQSTTIIVIATVFIFAAYFAIVDFAVGHTVDAMFQRLASH